MKSARGFLLVVVPALFLTLLLISRRESAGPESSTPVTSIPSTGKGNSPFRVPSRLPETAGPGKSRAAQVAAVRRLIQERQRHWTGRWWRDPFHLHPPLPEDPELLSLIAELKAEGGAAAPGILGDLIEDAASERTQELYALMLSGLQDPAAESLLTRLLSDGSKAYSVPGIAFYGLGLLKTESAWKICLARWEKEQPPRSLFYPGMGVFGAQALPLLLKEAGAVGPALAWMAIAPIEGPEAREPLLDLLDTSADDSVRHAAAYALSKAPDPATVSRLFDRLADRERREDVTGPLRELFTYGAYSLAADPRLLERIVTTWDQLPLDVRWALWNDPALRKAKPDAIDGLGPPEKMKWTFVWALANDPSRHDQLAAWAAAHPGDLSLHWLAEGLKRQGELVGPSLIEVARGLAFNPDGEGRYFGWQVLATGPADVRAKALADYSEQYERTPSDRRLKSAVQLEWAGPDAAPVALDLLRREANPVVRFELLATALSTPGREVELRTLAAAEIEQVLSGATDPALRFASAYPGSKTDGLDRYALLVRDIFSAYGTPEHIPRIREYFSRLLVNDPERSDDDYRESLQWRIQESIDTIRARK